MAERPHVLIVRDASPPYEDFLSMHDWADWDLEHFDDCPMQTLGEDDAGMPFQAYVCAVGRKADEIGVRWSLKYSGTPVEKPGRYLIEAWHDVIRGYEWTEYDEGLRLVDPDPVPQSDNPEEGDAL